MKFLIRDEQNLKPEINDKIQVRLVKYCFYHIRTSLLISLFCSTILFFGLFGDNNDQYLYSWYGLTCVVTIFRFIMARQYQKHESTMHDYIYWRNLFILGALWGGICWSYLVIFIFPVMTNLEQTLCILILAGVTAGSVTTLSGIKTSVVGYLIFSLVPLILELILIKTYIYQLFTFTAVVYFLFLIIISFNIHNIIRNVIFLQFENDSLLKKLHHHATHDTLTGIDNTRQFYANLGYAIEQAEFSKSEFTLLFIDLDHFKNINDNYGHEIGDKLLIQVANRLKSIVRNADFVARIGGDEFTIILWKLSSKEHIERIAKKICYSLSEPFEIDMEIFHVSACIGISIFPEDGNDSISIIKAADSAMYHVKRHGRNNFCFASDLTLKEMTEANPPLL